MGSTLFRDPQARSSALATLGTLQPQAFGSLNHVDPLDSVSNYYLDLEHYTSALIIEFYLANVFIQEYKPPSSKDIPIDFHVELLKDAPNPIGVLGSKGVLNHSTK